MIGRCPRGSPATSDARPRAAPSCHAGGNAGSSVDFGSGFQIALPQAPASAANTTIVIWVAKLDGATGHALAATSLGAASEGRPSWR